MIELVAVLMAASVIETLGPPFLGLVGAALVAYIGAMAKVKHDEKKEATRAASPAGVEAARVERERWLDDQQRSLYEQIRTEVARLQSRVAYLEGRVETLEAEVREARESEREAWGLVEAMKGDV